MLLAIDVGNTNTSFAVFIGERLRADWRVSTQAARTSDEYAALLLPLMTERGIEHSSLNAVVISSVVPAALDPLIRYARRHLKVESPMVLSPDMDFGMKVNYSPVSDVGVDRIANAVAAHSKYIGKVIVVDFGTATTLDAVSSDGEYLGGAIAPGIAISLEALVARAAKLTGVTLVAPDKVIGSTTVESVQSGMVFGFAGQVDALVDRFQEEMGGGAKVVGTGGLAETIAPHSRTIELCDETLTLEGLEAHLREKSESRKVLKSKVGEGSLCSGRFVIWPVKSNLGISDAPNHSVNRVALAAGIVNSGVCPPPGSLYGFFAFLVVKGWTRHRARKHPLTTPKR